MKNTTVIARAGSMRQRGFTIIEMIMVILLIAILASVAIPQFLDFRAEAKNAATQNALGVMRTGIALQYGQQLLRCSTIAGQWPELAALNANDITSGTHCTAGDIPETEEVKFVAGPTLPNNPWTDPAISTVAACVGAACTATDKCAQKCDNTAGTPDVGGWCYDVATGTIWANSSANPNTNECSF